MNHDTDESGLNDLLHYVPVSGSAKRDLVARMRATGRFYHGPDHLALLWQRHRLHSEQAGFGNDAANTLVASAIAYHDSIYDAARLDNERRSSAYWMKASRGSGLSEADRRWVATTIRATQDHLAYRAADTAHGAVDDAARERMRIWMLDLDLTPLGETPEVFEQNTRRLRQETQHLDDANWNRVRLAFLRRHAEAPRIYRSPVLAAVFEAPARRNLERALIAA